MSRRAQNSSRRQRTRYNRSRLAQIGVERLEDRRMLAVGVLDVKSTIGEFQSEFGAAISVLKGSEKLAADLNIVSEKLGSTISVLNDINAKIDATEAAAQTNVATYLNSTIASASNNVVTASNVSVSADSNTVSFTLQVNFTQATQNLLPSLDETALGGVKFGATGTLTFGLTNQLVGYFNFKIVDTDGNAATAPDSKFIPGAVNGQASRIEYKPMINSNSNFQGQLAGLLSYSGQAEVTMGPTFEIAYGNSLAPVAITQISQPNAPSVLSPNLDVKLRADLNGTENLQFKLPNFGYSQRFRFDVSTGNSIDLGAAGNPSLYLDGTLLDSTNENSLAVSAAIQVLDDAGVEVVGQFVDAIPEQVTKLALGDVELYKGVTLADVLISVDKTETFNTPLDFLSLVGVPPIAIEAVETIFRMKLLKTKLENLDPNSSGQSDLDSIEELVNPGNTGVARLRYLGDDPNELPSKIIEIFQGKAVDVVKYELDITNSVYAQALETAGLVKISRLDNSAGGKTNYLVGEFKIDSETFVERVTQGLPEGSIKDGATTILKWLVSKGGVDFSFEGDVKLAAAAQFAVDTSFLLPTTTGSIAEKIQKSIYVSAGNVVDFSFNAIANGSFSASEAAGGVVDLIVGGGQAIGKGLQSGAESLGSAANETFSSAFGLAGTGVPILDNLLDAAGSAEAGVEIGGEFIFGICDPIVNDGRLTLHELVNDIGLSNLDEIFAVSGGMNFEISGSGSIAGIPFSMDTGKVDLLGGLDFGCTPEPDGPSLSNFDNGPVSSGMVPRPTFAEPRVLDDGTKVLQVYGSSKEDIINLRGLDYGTLAVSWNKRRRIFDPADFDVILVGLRGRSNLLDLGYAPQSDAAIVPTDGGDDSVTIHPSVPNGTPVFVHGGSGNDLIRGHYGDRNTLNDYYQGQAAFFGGDGEDRIVGTGGVLSVLQGEGGDDRIYAGVGINILYGGQGSDSLFGLPLGSNVPENTFTSVYVGGKGDDWINVGNVSRGDHFLIGGDIDSTEDPGRDLIVGGFGNERIILGNAIWPDQSVLEFEAVETSAQRGVVLAGPGDDQISGAGGNDLLVGGWLFSGHHSGKDIIDAGPGNDVIVLSNIVLMDGQLAPTEQEPAMGAGQAETANGGAGDDTFLVGDGAYTTHLNGQDDNDKFVLSSGGLTGKGNLDERTGRIAIDGGTGGFNQIFANNIDTRSSLDVTVTQDLITGIAPADIEYGADEAFATMVDPKQGIHLITSKTENDRFHVNSLRPTDSLYIETLGGDDLVIVGNGDINFVKGMVTVIAGDNHDHVMVDDSASNLKVDYDVTPTSVSSSNAEDAETSQVLRTFGGLTYDGSAELLTVNGSQAPNIFDVAPSVHTEYFIDGNLPEPQHVCAVNGDFLRLNTDGTTGRKLTITDVGEGFWAFDQPHQPVFFESIERFNHVDIIAIAEPAGNGSQPRVRVFDAETNEFKFEFLAYEADYENGISVAVGDVNEDGLPDIVTAPGRLRAPEVRVFSGAPMPGVQGTQIAELTIPASDTYGDNYVWGAHVAAGDVLGNGCNAIITAPGRNIETVKIYGHDPADPTPNIGQRPFAEMASFEPFADVPEMIGGAYVAVADFDGDDDNNHRGDIVVGSGSGIPSQVRVFESSAELAFTQIRQIDDSDQETLFGLKVATGDIDGDETPDIVTSGLSRGSSVVNVYDGTPGSANTPVQTLTAFTDLSMIAPVDVAIADFDENGMDDIFAHQGPDGRNNSQVRIFDHTSNQIGSYDPISASQPSVALQLDRDHGFTFTGDYRTNQNGLNEKWISSESGASYYITPDGNLYRWHSGLVSNATLIATLHPCVYIEPELLHLAFDTYAASNADAEDRLPVSLSIDKIGIRQGNNFYLDANGNGTWNQVLAGDTFRDFGISSIATTATPVTGDWDGDGMDDLGLYNNGRFYLDTNGNGVWNKVVGGDTFRDFGISSIAATAIPVTGDWDGDGDDDLGLFNDGKFYLDTNDNGAWDKVAGGDTFTNFGISSIGSTATPVTGDWNGDGEDDLGLFKDGRFYLDTSGNFKWDQVSGGDTFRNFGISTIAATAKPMTGNWDGDSDDDLGLFNDGRFYLDTNGNGVWDKVLGGDTYHNFGIDLAGGAVSPLAGRWQRPSSLMAAARSNGQESLAIPASPAVDLLRADQLQPIIDAALVRIAASGVSGAELNTLSSVIFAIADLPGAQLGSTSGSRVTLDAAAAGYGWFIDPTPQDDSEFQSDSELSTTESRLRMDLLTVVMHELQHVLGHGHTNGSNDLLNPELPTGRRRLPADDLDTLMGESDLLSEVLSLPDAQESFREV